MFDRHYHDHVTKMGGGPSRVDVHEHRAPTDDSVRLLGEMEDKVLKRIIKQGPVEAMPFKGAVTHMYNVADPGSTLHISFSIGGERYDVPVKLEHHMLMSADDYARYLLIEASIAIAQELLPKSEDVRTELEGRFKRWG